MVEELKEETNCCGNIQNRNNDSNYEKFQLMFDYTGIIYWIQFYADKIPMFY